MQHTSLPSAATADKTPDPPAPAGAKLPETTGEKWFSIFRFAAGESVILFTTAVLAYIAHPVYGKDNYGPVPNVLKSMQSWLYERMPEAATKILPFKDHISKRVGLAFASTTLLMHGGNLFTPFMKMIEDRKERIVSTINRHYGKPGEEAAGKLRVQAEPKQTWGDIIKGRLLSWLFVFTSFVGADALLGKDSAGKHRFDTFEEWFGKKVASFTAKGKQAMASEMFHENKAFRFGKILALDIYATAAALVIWISISKFSAMHRTKKLQKPESEVVDIASDFYIGKPDAGETLTEEKKPLHENARMSQRQNLLDKGTGDFRSRAESTQAESMAL